MINNIGPSTQFLQLLGLNIYIYINSKQEKKQKQNTHKLEKKQKQSTHKPR